MHSPQSVQVYDAHPKVPVSEFVPELEFEFTDIPSDAFAHYVLRAINKFARDSNALRRTQYIKTIPCVNTYLLLPHDCVDIVAIMRIGTGNCDTVIRTLYSPTCLACGSVYAWFSEPNILHLEPMRREQLYRVEMSVAPTYDACEVDKKLLTDYYDTIISGVKSYLYNITDKPWSSVQRAQESMLLFHNGIHRAAMETLTRGQRGGFKRKIPRVL